LFFTVRYDTKCDFNVRSIADKSHTEPKTEKSSLLCACMCSVISVL